MYFFKNLTRRSESSILKPSVLKPAVLESSILKPSVRGCIVILLMILLLAGCDLEPKWVNTGFIPIGEWSDGWGSGYNITTYTLEYYTPFYSEEYPGENIKGNIKEAIDFSQNAGVLIVQITTSTTNEQVNKFIGIYYKNYTASHVFLANAIDESYATILKNTFAEAKNTFNVDNVETHVTYWGSGYNK